MRAVRLCRLGRHRVSRRDAQALVARPHGWSTQAHHRLV